MQDAAQSRRTPDLFENAETIGPRVAAMNDEGHLCLARQRELLAKNAILNVAGRMIVEIVEPNLAPSDHFRMLRECRKLIEMLRPDFLGLVRMDSHGSVNPIVLLGKWQRRVKLFRTGAGADGQQRRYSCTASAIQHGLAVLPKLRGIDMRVGVNTLQ